MFGLSNRRNNDLDFFNSFDNLFNNNFFNRNNAFKMDVQETDQDYIIEAEMPGIKKEEISLDYNNDTLYIAVNHEEEKEEKDDKKYLRRERRSSSMARGVYLKDINVEAIDAKLENGVLKITAPKTTPSTPKYRIEVK